MGTVFTELADLEIPHAILEELGKLGIVISHVDDIRHSLLLKGTATLSGDGLGVSQRLGSCADDQNGARGHSVSHTFLA